MPRLSRGLTRQVQLSVPEAAMCPTCGGAIDETSNGDLGCMVCLLRVGLSGDDQIAGELPASVDDRFGIYFIERRDDGSLHELGRGAMGVTYRALDTTLQRRVALKIIKIDLAGRSPEARERFMREARTAASLRHENIATVFQFGIREDTGQCFYAMELIEGETLEERIRRTGPLDARATVAIAQQVTAALAAAEKRGLVHRDLKPANLMLVAPEHGTSGDNRKGEVEQLVVRIIDFGLAKALNSPTDQMSLTRGGFVGTPAFASPEQFENEALDVRSDIYSLGATLWVALTGKNPFSGRSVEEIRGARQSGALPIEQLKAAHVPSRLIALLESMLALEPAARPGTRDLMLRVRRCSAQANGLTKPVRLAFAAGLVLMVAVLAFFFLWPSHSGLPQPQKKAPLNPAGTSNLQAREAYVKARSLLSKRNHPTNKQAIESFEKAIALDPNYAQAYAALAEAYPLVADNDPLIGRSEDFAKARAAARKAIELDPTLAAPHTALGLVAMNYEWDWKTAEEEYKRAIELDPNYPTAHHWYAEFLCAQGRSDEAVAEIKRAHQLDPKSTVIQSDTGKILFYGRRYDAAVEALQTALKSDPTFVTAHQFLAQVYTEKAFYDKALIEFKAGEGLDFELSPWTNANMGRTLALAGRKGEALQKLHELLEIRKRREIEPQVFIPIYIGLGEKDDVFALLEKEYDVRSTGLTSLKVNPLYDSLRSDPRFVDLLRRVHFAP